MFCQYVTNCWKKSQTIAEKIQAMENKQQSEKCNENDKQILIEEFEKQTNLIYLPKLDILINNAATTGLFVCK